jgi:hypothetical protein
MSTTRMTIMITLWSGGSALIMDQVLRYHLWQVGLGWLSVSAALFLALRTIDKLKK